MELEAPWRASSFPGAYVIRLTATDAGGNSGFDELTFTRDATNPSVDAGSDSLSANKSTMKYRMHAWMTSISSPGSMSRPLQGRRSSH